METPSTSQIRSVAPTEESTPEDANPAQASPQLPATPSACQHQDSREVVARRARSAVAGTCTLYRFYSETELLYIGVTGAGSRQRFKGHQSDKQWWPRVRHIQVEHYETREEAEDQEAAQIQVLRPVFNIQHNTDPILEPTRDDESQHHRCSRCSASYVSHEEKPGLNLCVRCRRLVKARAEKRERGQGKLRSV